MDTLRHNGRGGRRAITVAEVTKWAQAAGWRKAQILRLDASSIANACNKERKHLDHEKSAARKIAEFRFHTKQIRALSGSLEREISAIIFIANTWNLTGHEAEKIVSLSKFLKEFKNQFNKIAPLLRSARNTGGQQASWGEFVDRLDRHICASLFPDVPIATTGSPEVSFLTTAIDAVFFSR